MDTRCCHRRNSSSNWWRGEAEIWTPHTTPKWSKAYWCGKFRRKALIRLLCATEFLRFSLLHSITLFHNQGLRFPRVTDEWEKQLCRDNQSCDNQREIAARCCSPRSIEGFATISKFFRDTVYCGEIVVICGSVIINFLARPLSFTSRYF